MSALSDYRKRLTTQTDGQLKKKSSDLIMEATWDGDIQSKKAYIYDYDHDDEPTKYLDLHPENSITKTPIDIKFIVNSYNSESSDIVGYHLQFKPSFNWEEETSLSYYKKKYAEKYKAEFPLGLYVDVPDEKGRYRKWLITEAANNLGNQFPTWYILPVDYLFQWVYGGVKYQVCGVSRSQNSYNSGEYANRLFTLPENQRKCLLPMNDYTSTIFYNQRVVISAPVKTPIVWHCSKVEQLNPAGISRLTLAQDLWDEHTDVFEYESIEDGSKRISSIYDYDEDTETIVGMWASYTNEPIKEESTTDTYGVITYSGIKPEIKVGGNYKKFTITFYDGENNVIEYPSTKELGTWSVFLNDIDITSDESLINIELVSNNQSKIKFLGDDTYIGSVMKIIHNSFDNLTTTIEINIVGL